MTIKLKKINLINGYVYVKNNHNLKNYVWHIS